MSKAIEGIDLKDCRGYETEDVNDYLVLVQAPIEQTAQAIAQIKQIRSWQHDVYGQEIEVANYGILAFQLLNHSWTVVRELSTQSQYILFEENEANSISNLLHSKAITFSVSDSANRIGYDFYQCGQCIEKFCFSSDSEEELLENDDEHEDEDEDDQWYGNYQFQSQIRQIQTESIGNPYLFTYNFLAGQDAFAPYLFKFRGEKRIVLDQKRVERGDFVRIDYLTL